MNIRFAHLGIFQTGKNQNEKILSLTTDPPRKQLIENLNKKLLNIWHQESSL